MGRMQRRWVSGMSIFLAVALGIGQGGIMRASGTYTRARKLLHVRPSAGVDVTTAATDLDARRGAYMRNLMGENGALCKRPGWRQVAQVYETGEAGEPIFGRVHGMWHYDSRQPDGTGRDSLIVHAGGELYDVDTKSWTWFGLDAGGVVCDAPSEGFSLAGRLWLVGMGAFYTYTGRETYGRVDRVAELSDVYVPVTTVGISDVTAETDARTSLDPVNLLTAKRINKMVGRELREEDEGKLWFKLDGKPVRGSDITVEIETKNSSIVRLVTTGEVILSEKILVEKDSKVEVGRVNYASGIISLGENTGNLTPPISGMDNITVTFESEAGNRAALIDSAMFGVLFGEDGLTDRLLLGGFSEYRNRVYYSAPGDPTYFPDVNYFSVGSDMARVIGFSRVSDGTLAVHKEEMGGEPTIYYLIMSGETDAKTLDVTVTPQVVAGNRGEPILSRGALCDFYGDPLVLTERGVMAVTLRKNLATTERQIVERSRSIRTELVAHGRQLLGEATGIAYRGRYYLSIPGTEEALCYVADGGDVYTDESGGRQYEWYILSGLPAVTFCVSDGRLCFGTADGRICMMGDITDCEPEAGTGWSLYADRTWRKMLMGDVSYNYETRELTVNEAIDMREGDRICFDTGLYELLADQGTYTVDADGRIRLTDPNDIVRFYDGCIVIPDSAGLIGSVYTARDIDRGDGTFRLYYAGEPRNIGGDGGYRLLGSIEGEELLVSSVEMTDEGPVVKVKRYAEDTEALPLVARDTSTTVTAEIIGRVIRDKPVEASWYSGLFDLGGNHMEKTLHGMTVAVKPGSGRLSVGYMTRDSEGTADTQGIGGVNLGALTFSDFSFVGFASSYTKTLNRRHVNFVCFRFSSSRAVPCCVHDITVTYSVIGMWRGGH